MEKHDKSVPSDPQDVAPMHLDGRDESPKNLIQDIPHPFRAKTFGLVFVGEAEEGRHFPGVVGAAASDTIAFLRNL